MKESINMSILLLCIMSIPLLNQMNNSNMLIGNLIYAPFMVIIIIYLLNRKEMLKERAYKSNNKVIIACILMIVGYTLPPILGLTIFKYTPISNMIYIILFCVFIFYLYIVSYVISTEKQFMSFLKYSLLGNSLILITNIILNLDELKYIEFNTILSNERNLRAYFGFSHPNTTAMYILIEMLLIYLIYIKINNKKKIIGILFISILSIFLISTGSRTANMSLIIFILLEIYSHCIKRLNKYMRISILFLTTSFLFILLINKVDISYILSNSSGRDRALINNIKAIKEYGNFVFGIAPTSIEILKSKCMLDYTDNWIITQMIQFGILGVVIILSSIIILLIEFIKYRNYICINLLLTLFFYSMAERVLFVPGVTLSWFIWSLLFISSKNKNLRIEKL